MSSRIAIGKIQREKWQDLLEGRCVLAIHADTVGRGMIYGSYKRSWWHMLRRAALNGYIVLRHPNPHVKNYMTMRDHYSLRGAGNLCSRCRRQNGAGVPVEVLDVLRSL